MISPFSFWQAPAVASAQRAFGINHVMSRGGRRIAVTETELARWPFCTLREFATPGPERRTILLVAPLSGHFAFILRDMALGLLPSARVVVTDWINARFVPANSGDFGFEDNIGTVMRSLSSCGTDTHVIALCQSAVPALAAAAILARRAPDFAPKSLTLIGGPVDPSANPTRVTRLLGASPVEALRSSVIEPVSAAYPGAGRLVYPAFRQRSVLLTYYYRHLLSGGEVYRKAIADDGADPAAFSFWNFFISLMDLTADYFLQNARLVFQERQICNGAMCFRGTPVDPGDIRHMPLMTIEGENDDVAAPGQTRAAHALCPRLPDSQREALIVEGAGHFSLFHGRIFRQRVLPQIERFHEMAEARTTAMRFPVPCRS